MALIPTEDVTRPPPLPQAPSRSVHSAFIGSSRSREGACSTGNWEGVVYAQARRPPTSPSATFKGTEEACSTDNWAPHRWRYRQLQGHRRSLFRRIGRSPHDNTLQATKGLEGIVIWVSLGCVAQYATRFNNEGYDNSANDEGHSLIRSLHLREAQPPEGDWAMRAMRLRAALDELAARQN